MKSNTPLSLSAIVLLTVVGGCQTDNSSQTDFFPAERKVDQVINAQATRGARQDATLQAYHFDGVALNSLGQQKLAMLVPDDPRAEMLVYLNLPANSPATDARRQAVIGYVKQFDVRESQLRVELGSNPDNGTPAAGSMARLPKTESGKVEQGEKGAAQRYGEAAADLAKESSSDR
jgi:hypothetical protein